MGICILVYGSDLGIFLGLFLTLLITLIGLLFPNKTTMSQISTSNILNYLLPHILYIDASTGFSMSRHSETNMLHIQCSGTDMPKEIEDIMMISLIRVHKDSQKEEKVASLTHKGKKTPKKIHMYRNFQTLHVGRSFVNLISVMTY